MAQDTTTTAEPSKPVVLQEVRDTKNAELANLVHAEFASSTQDVTVDCADMAGFFVVVWDSKGIWHLRSHSGERDPYSSVMQHDMVTNISRSLNYPS